MALQRLLCGALTSHHSTPFRLVHILQKVFQNAPPSPSRTAADVMCGSGRSVHTLLSARLSAAARLSAPPARLSPRRSLCSSGSAQPSRDVTLFQHDRTRFFRLLSVFCGGQVLFWTYLAHFAYTELRDTTGGAAGTGSNYAPGAAAEEGGASSSTTTTRGLAGMWSFEMNLGSSAWRYGFTLGCLAIGAGVVGLGTLFCRRSVSRVVLHRGGRTVTVSTQSPLGPGRGGRITVPLSQVACHAHRHESPSFIPLRIKGHRLYFLLDKEGTVTNARLFDVTVGAYRPV